jgi:hypothetical protein
MTDQQKNSQPTEQTNRVNSAPRPNESGSVAISAFLRITDPNSKKTILETRA